MTTDTTKDNIARLFFSLIRCGIGNEEKLPRTPDSEEWQELYDIAKEQTLLGIAFMGIERIPKEQRPNVELLFKWHHQSRTIRELNRELTRKTILVSDKFRSEGFRNCILKGQGIAQYYPDPELRTPGDIDIWLEGGSRKVIEYVKGIVPDCRPTYHHVDFPVMEDVNIEVHYRPTWMYSPMKNRRLQRYFKQRGEIEFENTIATSEGTLHMPTVAFNMVFIPIHIYRHLFDEGVGMRQILDYYYVLQQPIDDKEKEECVRILKSIGLKRFTQALMYVMQEMFGLDEERMIAWPDRKQGEFLMREIMMAGNFGMNDSRFKQSGRGYNMPHFRNMMKRSFMLITRHPSETLCNPFFKIWHTWWMRRRRNTNGQKKNTEKRKH